MSSFPSSSSPSPSPSPSLTFFSDVCQHFTAITKIHKTGAKKNFFIRMFQSWEKTHPNESPFPLLRLFLPQLDTEDSHNTYGLRESQLGEIYADALLLPDGGIHRAALKEFKNPSKVSAAFPSTPSGDFAEVLHSALKARLTHIPDDSEGKLTINDIIDFLTMVAKSPRDKKKEFFKMILHRLSPSEHCWLARILLKDLKIGIKHDTLLKIFHPKAEEIFLTTSNLRLAAEVSLTSKGSKSLSASSSSTPSSWRYFLPFKVHLCAVRDIEGIQKNIQKGGGKHFIWEDKFDGERILIHKWENKIRIFTRKSTEYTGRHNYGEAISPWALQAIQAENAIIDGELLSWDALTGKFLRFGSNRTVAMMGDDAPNALGGNTGLSLRFVAFDIVALDGHILINKSLRERKRILHKIIKPIELKFCLVEMKTFGEGGSTDKLMSDRLLTALRDALLRGCEGIIVKDLRSPYILDGRNDTWVKLKPDGVSGLLDTIDAVIVGGYYGEGTRRSGGISHFLLALRHGDSFLTFGKVGSGYSDDQLKHFRAQMKSHEKKFSQSDSEMPEFLRLWKFAASDRPDCWYPIENAVVVEILCGEITPCKITKFSAGVTVRFPRMKSFRYDKSPQDASTVDMVKHMMAKAGKTKEMLDDDAADTLDLNFPPWMPSLEGDEIDIPQSEWKDSERIAPPMEISADDEKPKPSQSSFFASFSSSSPNSFLDDKSSPLKRRLVAMSAGKDDSFEFFAGKKAKDETPGKGAGVKGETSSGHPTSSIFSPYSFSAFSLDPNVPLSSVEETLRRHGGLLTSFPLADVTFAVIVAVPPNQNSSFLPFSARLTSLIRSREFNIVSFNWVKRCIDAGCFVDFSYDEILSQTTENEEKWKSKYDDFGDSLRGDRLNDDEGKENEIRAIRRIRLLSAEKFPPMPSSPSPSLLNEFRDSLRSAPSDALPFPLQRTFWKIPSAPSHFLPIEISLRESVELLGGNGFGESMGGGGEGGRVEISVHCERMEKFVETDGGTEEFANFMEIVRSAQRGERVETAISLQDAQRNVIKIAAENKPKRRRGSAGNVNVNAPQKKNPVASDGVRGNGTGKSK